MIRQAMNNDVAPTELVEQFNCGGSIDMSFRWD